MKTIKKIRAIIIILGIALIGVALLTRTVSTSQDPIDLAEVAARDMENKTLYYAEELYVMDSFAATEDEDVLYMAVMFEDETGDYVVVNMPVNKDDAIWEDVQDYLDDDSMQPGDYVLECYVMTETNVDVNDQLFDLFDEWIDDLERYAGLSVETNTEIRFNFLCDGDGDPSAEMAKTNTVFLVVGILCLVLAVVMLYFFFLRKPKAKAAAPVISYTVPTYPTQPANDAVNAQLQSYRSMVQNGLMTEEEFAKKQAELLNQ